MTCFICGRYDLSFEVTIPEHYRTFNFCSDVCMERLKQAIDLVLPDAKKKCKRRKPRGKSNGTETR